MKYIRLLLVLALVLLLPMEVRGEDTVPIYTPEELAAISENPEGSYILMNDLDMTGIPWKSLDFSGSLDGNGHAILNLQIAQPSDSMPESMDGNQKKMTTAYYGLFGTLVEAEIRNLKLINVRALAEEEMPVFLAALAGYSIDSVISDCVISGTLELRAQDRMYGVAGVIGYGSGYVERCDIDVTLICTDTDQERYCEQFMGGVFANGFVDLVDSTVKIQGYCSEYGFVHCGGVGGMYMQYPLAMTRPGTITGNLVEGAITFFECNTSRRAYCEAYCGEILAHNYHIRENTEAFTRDERYEYDTELRPEMCPDPRYTETVIPSGCSEGSYGFTEYTCGQCGHTYRDHYSPLAHRVSEWTVVQAPTPEKEGLSTGSCDECGATQERTEPRLQNPPTEAPTEPSLPSPQAPAEKGPFPVLTLVGIGVLAAAGLTALLLVKSHRKKNPHPRFLRDSGGK